MYVERARRAAGSGLSGLNEWLREFWDYNKPSTWATVFADAYGTLQYGKIPEPTQPTPAAPQTVAELEGAWTPAEAATKGQADWIARNQAQLIAAERAGTWSSEARLPVTASEIADWTERYKWPLVIGAAGLSAVLLLVAARR